jgi:predicted TIM-barrel fold metal-dependent hydrolase
LTVISKVLENLPKWIDFGLPDLRTLSEDARLDPPLYVDAQETIEDAVAVVLRAFDLEDNDTIIFETAVCNITIERAKLEHIVEKRQDARERFVHFAIMTLERPFEVWKAEYSDGFYRYLFIGTFKTKHQMLVIVSVWPSGEVLWNYMHSEAKALNKHRHGTLIYSSYPR